MLDYLLVRIYLRFVGVIEKCSYLEGKNILELQNSNAYISEKNRYTNAYSVAVCDCVILMFRRIYNWILISKYN